MNNYQNKLSFFKSILFHYYPLTSLSVRVQIQWLQKQYTNKIKQIITELIKLNKYLLSGKHKLFNNKNKYELQSLIRNISWLVQHFTPKKSNLLYIGNKRKTFAIIRLSLQK